MDKNNDKNIEQEKNAENHKNKEQHIKDQDVHKEHNNSQKTDKKDVIKEKDVEIINLKEQLKDANNKLLLTVADCENLKKRLQKDKEEAIAFANKNLVLDILPSLDGLDAAIASTQNEDIRKGIEMARDGFLNSLKKWGLEVIDDEGKEYDPMRHEACMFETSSEATVDTVMQTLQKGYALHSRVVRPSKVKVLKAE